MRDGRPRPTPHLDDEVLDSMARVLATCDPFDGRFLVHGARVPGCCGRTAKEDGHE
ncbi:hypothetical protein [Streptomyces sp. NPDC018833]|uniref:hypothetical protein n=1 Tax=Streptomyces sp. NPDC018833 TaxID=3365053 RepID=UPI0037B6305A